MQALDTFGGYQSAFQMDNEVYTYGNGGFMKLFRWMSTVVVWTKASAVRSGIEGLEPWPGP